jgi:tetratricopeptide (TPR) repeat protein
MNSNLQDLAINKALNGEWEEAIKINKLIVESNSDDIEALNRISRAYFELGDITKAKKYALEVIKFDKQNSIALKALSKYKAFKKLKSPTSKFHSSVNPSDFIEESGTTKSTELLNICSSDLLTRLSPGDELNLASHSHKVSITTMNNKYVGKVPDNLSAKIRLLTKSGYKYKVIVKSVDDKCIKVIIKEVKRGKGYENKKSFSSD